MSKSNTLDPILGPALQLENLPIIPSRMGAVQEADTLMGVCERLHARATVESDRESSQQLLNAAETLGVIIVSLVAYSRGRVPKLSTRKPATNIVVS